MLPLRDSYHTLTLLPGGAHRIAPLARPVSCVPDWLGTGRAPMGAGATHHHIAAASALGTHSPVAYRLAADTVPPAPLGEGRCQTSAAPLRNGAPESPVRARNATQTGDYCLNGRTLVSGDVHAWTSYPRRGRRASPPGSPAGARYPLRAGDTLLGGRTLVSGDVLRCTRHPRRGSGGGSAARPTEIPSMRPTTEAAEAHGRTVCAPSFAPTSALRGRGADCRPTTPAPPSRQKSVRRGLTGRVSCVSFVIKSSMARAA